MHQREISYVRKQGVLVLLETETDMMMIKAPKMFVMWRCSDFLDQGHGYAVCIPWVTADSIWSNAATLAEG